MVEKVIEAFMLSKKVVKKLLLQGDIPVISNSSDRFKRDGIFDESFFH